MESIFARVDEFNFAENQTDLSTEDTASHKKIDTQLEDNNRSLLSHGWPSEPSETAVHLHAMNRFMAGDGIGTAHLRLMRYGSRTEVGLFFFGIRLFLQHGQCILHIGFDLIVFDTAFVAVKQGIYFPKGDH